MTPEQVDKINDLVTYGTKDPVYQLNGKPIPAITSVMYRLSNKDVKQFEEAMRIIDLFIRKTIEVTLEQINEQT